MSDIARLIPLLRSPQLTLFIISLVILIIRLVILIVSIINLVIVSKHHEFNLI